MIRVAVDAREYTQPSRLTGIGRYLTNIIAPLADRQSDFEFVLYTHAPDSVPPKLVALPGVRVETLPRAQTQWVDQWILPRAARAAHADCFFSPYYKGPWFPGMPLIITVHDIMFLRLPALSPLVRVLTRLQLAAVIRRCQRIITVSNFSERDLVDLFPLAADKTTVMYSDIGGDWHRMLQDRSTSPVPGLPPDRFGRFFLYVGNFKPHKNVDLLVRAFGAALQTGKVPEHQLVLVGGDDENTPRILKLVKKLDLEKRVFVCRDIDDFSLSRLYQAADWFVTASEYEGFGYPPVEAMIADCPIICHPVTSLMEVVGSAALPIPTLSVQSVANVLCRALELSEADRREYVEAGRRQCRLFAPGCTAQAFARMVRGLVIPHGALPPRSPMQ